MSRSQLFSHNVTRAVSKSTHLTYEPQTGLFDCADALGNGVSAELSSIKTVRTCYAHVWRAVTHNLNKLKVSNKERTDRSCCLNNCCMGHMASRQCILSSLCLHMGRIPLPLADIRTQRRNSVRPGHRLSSDN